MASRNALALHSEKEDGTVSCLYVFDLSRYPLGKVESLEMGIM